MRASGKIVKVNDTYMHVYCIPKYPIDDKKTIIFFIRLWYRMPNL